MTIATLQRHQAGEDEEPAFIPAGALLQMTTTASSDLPAAAVSNLLNRTAGPAVYHHRLELFQILSVLGTGAFGKVYLARYRPTGGLFAIKSMKKEALLRFGGTAQARVERDILALLMDHGYELNPGLGRSPRTNNNMRNEQRAVHPFIVRLHCAFQTSSRVFLVMDYLQGGPLMDYLRKEALFSEEVARFYAAEMYIALQHLHSIGIVHRDLKPENVLLDHEGHVALTDFGLSKAGMGRLDTETGAGMAQSADASLRRAPGNGGTAGAAHADAVSAPNDSAMQTQLESIDASDLVDSGSLTHSWCGTEHYMAPELLAREGHSFAADYWSFGCLIYEMLTGEPPFSVRAQGLVGKRDRGRRAKVAAQAAADNKTGGKAPPENVHSRVALYKRIMKAKIKFPSYVSTEAQSLVRQLICRSPEERLRHALCLQHHRWFRGISWKRIRERLERPPITPVVDSGSGTGSPSASTAHRDDSWSVSPHSPHWMPAEGAPDTHLVAYTYVAPHALHAFGEYLQAWRTRGGHDSSFPIDHQVKLSSSTSSVSERDSSRLCGRNLETESDSTAREVADALEDIRIAVSEGIEIFSIDGAEYDRAP